jgi:hypothetical protein
LLSLRVITEALFPTIHAHGTLTVTVDGIGTLAYTDQFLTNIDHISRARFSEFCGESLEDEIKSL